MIHAPTNLVWIIGRTELKGPDDLSAANAIQKSYKLYPQGGEPVAAPTAKCRDTSSEKTPEEIVRAMSGPDFFRNLDTVISVFPPPSRDKDILESLERLGIDRKVEMDTDDLSDRNQDALDDGVRAAQKTMDASLALASRFSVWSPDPTKVPLGDYGDDYLIRSIVSQVGFGANRNEFAVYQNTKMDSDKDKLDGSKSDYTLHLKSDEIPPVNGFWSVTVYSEDGFLIPNEADRYTVGTHSEFEKGEDGSITITFASQKPEDVATENWLPVPEDRFEVTLRTYWPKEDILNGDWEMPPLVKE